MKLAILSCSPRSYSTRRLREAAAQRNHKVLVLNTLKFAIDLERGDPDLFYRQKQLSQYDAVLPRIAAIAGSRGSTVVFRQTRINARPGPNESKKEEKPEGQEPPEIN